MNMQQAARRTCSCRKTRSHSPCQSNQPVNQSVT